MKLDPPKLLNVSNIKLNLGQSKLRETHYKKKDQHSLQKTIRKQKLSNYKHKVSSSLIEYPINKTLCHTYSLTKTLSWKHTHTHTHTHTHIYIYIQTQIDMFIHIHQQKLLGKKLPENFKPTTTHVHKKSPSHTLSLTQRKNNR